VSSLTYFLALRFIKKGKTVLSTVMVLVTLILGFVFVKYQVEGWKYLNERGSFVGGNNEIRLIVDNELSEYGEDYIIVQKGNELNYFEGKFYDKRDKKIQCSSAKSELEYKQQFQFLFLFAHGFTCAAFNWRIDLFGGGIPEKRQA
jgi:hypothetical protein